MTKKLSTMLYFKKCSQILHVTEHETRKVLFPVHLDYTKQFFIVTNSSNTSRRLSDFLLLQISYFSSDGSLKNNLPDQ